MGTDEAHVEEHRGTGVRHRSPLTWLVAALAVLLIAAAAVFALSQRGATPSRAPSSPPPSTSPSAGSTDPDEATAPLSLTMPAEGPSRCMVPRPAVLRTADVAVDAVAAEVTDSLVTLDPTRFYAGGPADQVTVDQATVSMRDLIGAVRFEEGGRYLVAADGGDVLVCGFSGGYDPGLADLYTRAFAP